MLKLGGEEAGFTVYSGMLSLGACLGYLLTALDWTSLGVTTSLGLTAGNQMGQDKQLHQCHSGMMFDISLVSLFVFRGLHQFYIPNLCLTLHIPT
jgi:hypothetical protein